MIPDEFYAIISHFRFRIGRIKFELRRLLTMFDGNKERMLGSDALPELLTLIPELKLQLRQFKVSEQLIFGELLSKLTALQDVENRECPSKIDTNSETFELTDFDYQTLVLYKTLPDEVLNLVTSCRQSVFELKVPGELP